MKPIIQHIHILHRYQFATTQIMENFKMVRVAQDLGRGSGGQRALRHAEPLAPDKVPLRLDEAGGCAGHPERRHACPDESHPREGHDSGTHRARAAREDRDDAANRRSQYAEPRRQSVQGECCGSYFEGFVLSYVFKSFVSNCFPTLKLMGWYFKI